MDVTFTNSFFDSLKKMAWHQRLIYKCWETFRYNIPAFFGNIWRFRSELYEYRKYDWTHQIMMFRRGLELEVEFLEKFSNEIQESREKKVEKMRRAIEIIKWHEESDFLGLAEKELGYEYNPGFKFVPSEDHPGYFEMVDTCTDEEQAKNHEISERATSIETDTWNELIEILKGQDYSKFNKDVEWGDQFDGSGLQNWWA